MLRLLDRAVEGALGLIAAALIATAGGQVVARYLFNQPFGWVLELDVLLLVWLAMLSGYVGVRRKAHMAMDEFVGRLSPANRRRAALASYALCIGFTALLAWKSVAVVDAMRGIPFTTLGIEQPWLYASLPVGALLMLVALFDATLREWRTRP